MGHIEAEVRTVPNEWLIAVVEAATTIDNEIELLRDDLAKAQRRMESWRPNLHLLCDRAYELHSRGGDEGMTDNILNDIANARGAGPLWGRCIPPGMPLHPGCDRRRINHRRAATRVDAVATSCARCASSCGAIGESGTAR